jgi:hypothetical protein
VAREHSVDIGDTQLFFYEVYDLEYDGDQKSWKKFGPEESFTNQDWR